MIGLGPVLTACASALRSLDKTRAAKRELRDTEGRFVSAARIRVRAKAREMALRQGMTEQAEILEGHGG